MCFSRTLRASAVIALGLGTCLSPAHASDYDAATHTCFAADGGDSGASVDVEACADCGVVESRAPFAFSYASTERESLAWAECMECAGDNPNVVQLSAWCFDAASGLVRVDSSWSHARIISVTCPPEHPELLYHSVQTRF
jgi:hypothetical protein